MKGLWVRAGLLVFSIAVLLPLSGCVLRDVYRSDGKLIAVICDAVSGSSQEYTIGPSGAFVPVSERKDDDSRCPSIEALITGKAKNVPVQISRRETTATSPAPSGSVLQYMLDQARLSVEIVDPSTFGFTQVDLPGGGNTQYPTGMDMTPDGSRIWITQLAIGQNNAGITPMPPLVSIFNVTQQAFTGSFTLPNGISPNTIQFSLDGTSAYITNDGSPAEGASGVFANSSVLVVNAATQTVTKTIPTPQGAGSAVLSPDGLLLYTIGNNAGIGSNNLTVVDTTTNTVATSVALPNGAVKIFVNPTGTRLYIFWLRGIDVLDTATLQKVTTIPASVSNLNNYAVFSSDGGTAWLCPCGYGTIYQVDVRTNQVISTLPVTPHGFIFGTP